MTTHKRQSAAFIAVSLVLLLALPVSAKLDGDPIRGKKLFLTKGSNAQACMSCHPKGLTTGLVVRGKVVPNLTERVASISENKLLAKVLKHLDDDVGLDLSDDDVLDLVSFISTLPNKGFGDVPPEWSDYVRTKVKQ
ncbi:MAG TPA: hypothetical protein V6D05_18195 [Stenomitos sp.]